jgi:hypothetical protein
MKKLTLLTIIATAFIFGNCKSLQYGHIKKVGNNTYALETRVMGLDNPGYFLALCTADAAGNLKCVQGKDGTYGDAGFGAVVK